MCIIVHILKKLNYVKALMYSTRIYVIIIILIIFFKEISFNGCPLPCLNILKINYILFKNHRVGNYFYEISIDEYKLIKLYYNMYQCTFII